ncbi:MAG: UDP-N-acetylmuramate--L-alanine ligase [Bdellovibrionales bacterium]|nr:UDP-N-acetylmuramate--L-alanine ligase [Bdellovibrionales bacterium]
MSGTTSSDAKPSKFKHVHVIGVCGTLMGAFAAYLRRADVRVTGSDQNVYPPMSDVLKNAGVELFSPYGADNVTKINGKPDMVVVGNVISRGNAELEAFEKAGCPYVSLPEFMERHLLTATRNIVVAGTHGKTTTSSLMAHVLDSCGFGPSYFIGGVSQTLPHSFHVESDPARGKFFVLEGDEYDTAFWDKVPKFYHYLPNDVILTSVEYDHADIYPDLESVKRVFVELLKRIRPNGNLIVCIETPVVREVLDRAQTKANVVTYSRFEMDNADYTFKNLRTSAAGIDFDVIEKGKKVDSIHVNLPGEHNALNALAVYIEGKLLGIPSAKIVEGLASFKGVKRRQEERDEVRGVLVIDDFAHHPTAVRETLKALKQKYQGRRLIAIFEPRSATSRRKVFQKEYTEAFDDADEALIAIAYDVGKIAADNQFSSQDLVAGLTERGRKAACFSDVEQGVTMAASHAKKGDVIAVLSNGGFGGFIPKLIEQLKRGV